MPMENSDRPGGQATAPWKQIFREQWHRPIPARWILLRHLHALLVAFFALQIATGVLLMADYHPSSASAFVSMAAIADEAYFGWLIRSMHFWGTHVLLALATLTVAANYFARAYHGPRVVEWVIQLSLLFVLLGFGFTGTLLPWDQQAYWFIDLAVKSLAHVPVLGRLLLGLISPETEIGDNTLLRFYVFHIGFLPWLAVLFLDIRFWAAQRSDRDELAVDPQASSSSDVPSIPFSENVLNVTITALLGFGVLVSVAVLFPPVLAGPADPLSPADAVTPPWYFLALRGIGAMTSATAATFLVIAVALLLFLAPLLDRGSAHSTRRPILQWSLGVLLLALCVLAGLRGYFP